MDFFKSVASIAQNALESINNPNHLTPDQLMQEKYHVPGTEHILSEINTEYVATSRVLYSFSSDTKYAGSYLPLPSNANARVAGKLTLTENYLLLHKNDSTFDKVIFHVSSINKVQKIPNTEMVHVRLSTLNGMILDILCDTVRSKAELFWHRFNKQYQLKKDRVGILEEFQSSLYSEYLRTARTPNWGRSTWTSPPTRREA